MNIIRQTTRIMLSNNKALCYRFSDSWKERDEAQEKVYITRKESNSLLYPRGHDEKAFRKDGRRRSRQ